MCPGSPVGRSSGWRAYSSPTSNASIQCRRQQRSTHTSLWPFLTWRALWSDRGCRRRATLVRSGLYPRPTERPLFENPQTEPAGPLAAQIKTVDMSILPSAFWGVVRQVSKYAIRHTGLAGNLRPRQPAMSRAAHRLPSFPRFGRVLSMVSRASRWARSRAVFPSAQKLACSPCDTK